MMHSISKDNFLQFLKNLKSSYTVFIPVKKGNHRFYNELNDNTDNMVLGEVRSFEPLKAFFFSAREKVARNINQEVPPFEKKPYCIVGVKACDLKGFKTQDYVFLGNDYIDPFYDRNRKNNLVIAADCTCAIETCFCLALGLKPYAEGDFDINLSVLDSRPDELVIETGSEKGEGILKSNQDLFKEASSEAIKERDKQRQRVLKEVEKNIQENSIPRQDVFKGMIKRNYEASMWQDEAKTCVECGACNTICPTCHCFLLYDQKDKEAIERLRVWDSCMIKDFARVAGGANPREKLWMRLRNRFEKKFDYFPEVADIYACTGCGRCVTACPAKIDIRRVLRRLVGNE
jgi:sulfhydrogenase subunit beta (sulfur reductase)